jgi:hypothetical protein
MSTRAPGSGSDYSHNVVGLSADHQAVSSMSRPRYLTSVRIDLSDDEVQGLEALGRGSG